MTGDVERTETPQERLTRLAGTAVDGITGHPEHGDDVRGIVMLVAGERSGMAVFGYGEDEDGTACAFADLAQNLQALAQMHGKTLTFMDGDALGVGPN